MNELTPPDCWHNGVPVRCYKCHQLLGNSWTIASVAPNAAGGGARMPFHMVCAPIVFHGPMFGEDRVRLAESARAEALKQAVEACVALIEDYKSHTDSAGNRTGDDFNVLEITAVEAAIERIKAIKAMA
jgi:hypothetical protein